MLSAICYSSNSGYTKDYAKLLGEALSLPVYNLKRVPKSVRGKEIIYMGWVMAGKIVGYAEADKKYDIEAVVQVGMAPPSEALNERAVKNHHITGKKVFTLRGGFDLDRLHGVNKLIMSLKAAQIKMSVKKAKKKGQLSEDQKISEKMVTEGYSCVCMENLSEIVEWAKKEA